MQKKYDLDERLINFASDCIDISEKLPKTLAGNHIASQLVRSSTSPALHYGEAQSAESRNDFIHKMKVCLKELRETFNCLRLIKKKNWYDDVKLSGLIAENNDLLQSLFPALRLLNKIRNDRANFLIPCSTFFCSIFSFPLIFAPHSTGQFLSLASR